MKILAETSKFLRNLSTAQLQSLLGSLTFGIVAVLFIFQSIDFQYHISYQLIFGFCGVIFLVSALTAIYGALKLGKKWLLHQIFSSIVYLGLSGLNSYRFWDDFTGRFAVFVISFGSVFNLFVEILRKEAQPEETVNNEPAPPYTLYDERITEKY